MRQDLDKLFKLGTFRKDTITRSFAIDEPISCKEDACYHLLSNDR